MASLNSRPARLKLLPKHAGLRRRTRSENSTPDLPSQCTARWGPHWSGVRIGPIQTPEVGKPARPCHLLYRGHYIEHRGWGDG